MAGPWEQFQTEAPQAPAAGPWTQFQSQAPAMEGQGSDGVLRLTVRPPDATPAPDAPQPSIPEDMAKSFASGVGSGFIGLTDIPHTVNHLLNKGNEYLVDKFPGAAVPRDQSPLPLPHAADVQKSVEGYTGEFYKPKTVPGQYAHTAGEFTPGALMPGGAVARTMNVLAPAVGAETAGQLYSQSPTARMVGGIAGAFAPGALGRAITPARLRPEREALARTLEAEGVPLTAGQRTGSRPVQWAESVAADTPLASGKASAFNEQQGRAFTGAVLRRMGMTGDELATPQAINQGVQNLQNTFNTLSARNTLRADRPFVSDLTRTKDEYLRNVLPSQRGTGRQNIEGIVNDVATKLTQNGGRMPGTEYQALRDRLGKMQVSVQQSDTQLAEAIKGIRKALDGAMNRSISPNDQQAWQTVRKQWGNWKTMENAITGAGPGAGEGFINPLTLRSSVAGNNRGQYARGQGDLHDLARAGGDILKPLPQSGTAPRQAASNLWMGISGALAGNAAGGPLLGLAGALGPTVLGAATLSRPVQAYLRNQIIPNLPRRNSAAINGLLSQDLALSPSGR